MAKYLTLNFHYNVLQETIKRFPKHQTQANNLMKRIETFISKDQRMLRAIKINDSSYIEQYKKDQKSLFNDLRTFHHDTLGITKSNYENLEQTVNNTSKLPSSRDIQAILPGVTSLQWLTAGYIKQNSQLLKIAKNKNKFPRGIAKKFDFFNTNSKMEGVLKLVEKSENEEQKNQDKSQCTIS